MSSEWPVAPFGGLDQSSLGKIQMVNILKTFILLLHIYAGDAMLFNRQKYSEPDWIGTRVSIFLMTALMRHFEYERAYWIPCFSTTFQGRKTQLLHSACQEQRRHLSS